MRARIETVFRVSPDLFWDELFFDRDYNTQLHRELGFVSWEVLSFEKLADGRVQQRMRAEPPLHIPDMLKRRLRERLFYTDEGTYDPRARRWEFRTLSSLAPEAARVGGAIFSEPHADGMLHVVELEVRIDVLGLGSIIERVIERNARDSYRTTARFTEAYVSARGR